MANFNAIAPFYDAIKKLVFQNSINKATEHFISSLPPVASILIIGGGTGALLKHFNPKQQITYLEASAKMIEIAKEREYHCKVHFIKADLRNHVWETQFDAIISPFILDCFSEEALTSILSGLNDQLKIDGLWLHADFYPQNAFQGSLVKLMYFFFRLTAKLSVSSIPDFDLCFKELPLSLEKKLLLRSGFIQSRLYRKID